MGYLENLRLKVAQRKKYVSERKAKKRQAMEKYMIEESKTLATETAYYKKKASLSKARSEHRKQKYAPLLGAIAGARKALKQPSNTNAVPTKDLFPSSKSSDDLLGMSKAVPKKKVVLKKKKQKVYFEYK